MEAKKLNITVIKRSSWREKDSNGKLRLKSGLLDEYRSHKIELNVLPFCTQYIPLEIIDEPKYKSIIYHPSLLPAHRFFFF